MLLSELFGGVPDIEISGLCMDSRKAEHGNIFFCLKGIEADGHLFAGKACEKGAVAVVHSEDMEKKTGVIYIKTEDVNKELNRCCDIFYGSPSKRMTVFGVTGTNGKTTTTSIISEVYSHLKPCAYMGTIAVRFADVNRMPSLTTPDPLEIHQNLQDMVHHNMEAVAMEVSSHGLAMGRVDSVDFDAVIFTNLTYDHLDYHKTMENYFDAKKRLFQNMKPEGIAILNRDDISFEELRVCLPCPYVSYSTKEEADYRAEDIKLTADGSEFTLLHRGTRYKVETNLVALYNIYNLLGAIAAMHQKGMPLEEMIPYMKNLSQIDGRMEKIDMGQDFQVIVDYAHTPDGFEKVFEYAKEITEKGGRIFSVFGCAGKRDRVKRKVLGEIADKYCDRVFVTEEDPRNEQVEDIASAIMAGIAPEKAIFIKERDKAIETAIGQAQSKDCVLILGKGDETYMYYEEGRRPWIGDHEMAKVALKKLLEGRL